MATPTKAETQARLAKERAEQQATTAKQKAARLAMEAKNNDKLDQHAKRVAALYASMREFEALAEEKAGFELKKAAEKRAALDQALVEARELCKAASKSFKEFQEKYAPDYKRTRLYQVLQIADGRKTVEEVREGARDRKRRQRAGESVRDKSDVTDDAAPEGKEAESEPARGTETASSAGSAKGASAKSMIFDRGSTGSQLVFKASAEEPLDQVQGEFTALADKAEERDAIANKLLGPMDAEPTGAAEQSIPPAPGKAADDATPHTKPDDGHSVLAVTLKALMNEALVLCEAEHNWEGLRATKEQRDTAVKTLRQLRELLAKIAAPKAVH